MTDPSQLAAELRGGDQINIITSSSIIPKNVNDLFLKEFINRKADANLLIPDLPPGVHLNDCNFREIITSVLSQPIISGAISSLVGDNPIFDHHHIHVAKPNSTTSQHNHQDSTIDPIEHPAIVEAKAIL